MFDDTNRQIYSTRKNVINFYKEKYEAFRHQYLEAIDRLLAFGSYLNYQHIVMAELGQVKFLDSCTDLFAMFGKDNAVKLIECANDVNTLFDKMHEAYVVYFIKSKELGF